MKYIKLLIIALILNISLFAQIDKEIIVVKAYKPSISDAYKMNILPTIVDTTRLETVFNYQIYPKSFNVDFQLEPIKPAKLQGEPLSKLYRTYIKVGFGNYYTPLAEIYYNTLRSKKSSMGAYYKHLSSFGKMKIRDEKVYSGFSDNSLGLFGKKFLNNRRTLYSDIDMSRNGYYYYGYSPNTLTVTPADKKDLDKQQLLSLIINTGLKNNYTDSLHLNYKTELSLKHIQDNYKVQENEISLFALGSKFYNSELLGLNSNLTFYNNKIDSIDFNSWILNIKPWAKLVGDKWKINIGAEFTSDIYADSIAYHIYPNVLLQYNVVDNFIIPYIGYNGFLQKNSYRSIIGENQFINPGTYVNNTNHKIVFNGGIRGNFTPELTYNFNAKYSVIENMYFYINNLGNLPNRFTVIYDDMDMLTLTAELDYKKTEKLNFILKGHYYQYTLKNELEAWNKPDYTAHLITNYNLRDKILLNLNLFAIGERFTKFYEPITFTPQSIKLDMYFDANLGIEYRYSKILSGFLNFNNIANTKYNLWYGYPMQRFNVMFGLTYSL